MAALGCSGGRRRPGAGGPFCSKPTPKAPKASVQEPEIRALVAPVHGLSKADGEIYHLLGLRDFTDQNSLARERGRAVFERF